MKQQISTIKEIFSCDFFLDEDGKFDVDVFIAVTHIIKTRIKWYFSFS